MIDAIEVAIDSSGRVVIPKAIRNLADIRPGVPWLIRYRDGRIELEPAPRRVQVVKKGKVLVAMPDAEGETLDRATVRETQRLVRKSRSS